MKGRTVTAGLAAALIIATPFVAQKEGLRNDPYYDTVGVRTVCYGETNVPMKRYSTAECQKMFTRSLEGYGAGVLKCTPSLEKHPVVLASAISFSYNIGVAGYCNSVAAKKFNAGDLRGGCLAYMGWLRPPEIKGRRIKERDFCLSGVKNAN